MTSPLPGARTAALAGLAGAGMSTVLVGLLHVLVDPAEVNPMRRTISEYAFGDHRPLFDAGILLLAAGSAAVLVALPRVGGSGSSSRGIRQAESGEPAVESGHGAETGVR